MDAPHPVLTGPARARQQGVSHAPLSRLLTVRELADLLQVPPKTIYTWRYKGIGPRAVPIGKYLRFRPEDVGAWLDAHADDPEPDIGTRRARTSLPREAARAAEGGRRRRNAS